MIFLLFLYNFDKIRQKLLDFNKNLVVLTKKIYYHLTINNQNMIKKLFLQENI